MKRLSTANVTNATLLLLMSVLMVMLAQLPASASGEAGWDTLAHFTFEEGESGYKSEMGEIASFEGISVLTQYNEGLWARVRITFESPIALNSEDTLLRYRYRIESHGAPLLRATHHPSTETDKILIISEGSVEPDTWHEREVRLFDLAIAGHSSNKDPLAIADNLVSVIFQSRSEDGNTKGHSIYLDYVEIVVPKR